MGEFFLTAERQAAQHTREFAEAGTNAEALDRTFPLLYQDANTQLNALIPMGTGSMLARERIEELFRVSDEMIAQFMLRRFNETWRSAPQDSRLLVEYVDRTNAAFVAFLQNPNRNTSAEALYMIEEREMVSIHPYVIATPNIPAEQAAALNTLFRTQRATVLGTMRSALEQFRISNNFS